MARVQVDLDLSRIRANLRGYPQRVDRLIAGALQRQQGRAEAYMRLNARWSDQTGNARSGLHAVYAKESDIHTLTLAHGVPYGIWLEVRYGGRYAIILESMLVNGREAMSLINAGIARSTARSGQGGGAAGA